MVIDDGIESIENRSPDQGGSQMLDARNFNNGELIASGAPKAILPALAAAYVVVG